MANWWLIIVPMILFTWLIVISIRSDAKRSNTWVVIAEGRYHKATFERELSTRRMSASAYSVRPYMQTTATIFFTDGTYHFAPGIEEIPFDRLALIRILMNGNGECKLELAEEPRTA